MANPQDIGALRERVRIERRADSDDGAGNTQGPWAPLLVRAARIQPIPPPRRGAEELQAGRLEAVAQVDVWLRYDTQTADIRASDRVVDTRNAARVYNIMWIANLDEEQRFICMRCESGVAETETGAQ